MIQQSIEADEALIKEKSEELPDKYMNLGNAYLGDHKLNEAIAAFQRVIELRPEDAAGYYMMAYVIYITGNLQGTLKYRKKSLEIIRRNNPGQITQDEGTVLGSLGMVFSDLGQLDSARVYHRAALKIHREIGYRHGEALDLGNLGVGYSFLGQRDSALVYLREALKIDREIGYRQGEAFHLRHLGLMLRALEQPDSSRFYLQAALKIDREIGYRLEEAATLASLGLVFSALEQSDSARVYFDAALKIHREIGYRQGEASDLVYLGLVFHISGQLNSALVYHRAALKIHREIDYRKGEAESLCNLGLVFSDLGQPDSARVYLLTSTRIFIEIQSPTARLAFKFMNDISETMNQTLIARGDQYLTTAKLDSAETFYRLAWQDSREFFYSAGEMRALNRLSFLLHERVFRFLEAFEIDQQRQQLDSTDISILCDFAEKHFTTARFTEAETRLAELIANPDIEESSKTALRAIGIANLLALQKPAAVKPQLQQLVETVSAQADSFTVTWTFEGTKTFIRQSESLAPYRDWLLSLFAALEAENREAILVKLKVVQEQF